MSAEALDPQLVGDCVDFVPFAAYIGIAEYRQLWDSIGYDVTLLRNHCEGQGVAILKQISKERADTKAFLEAAAAGDAVTVNESAAAPFPLADVNPSSCHASYEGACVPIDSDVDCTPGEGNGPSYVSGPVYIVAGDPYGLDRDGDGVACEPKP